MSTWNYRVILKDGQYAIHEVFYNDQCEPWACTKEPVGAAGDTLAELIEDMEHYLRALKRPVLAYENFPNERAAPESGDTTPWEEVKAELVAEGLL
jgi:hypothetical protein